MSRVLIVSHYYDPEPLPKVGELARALAARGHDVRVVTGLPTYPAGRLYDGYRLGLRRTERGDGVAVTRTFEVPYHGRSPVGRAVNYGSTAASLMLGWTRGWAPDAVYVWSPPPTTVLPARVLARAGRGFSGHAGRGRTHCPRIVMDIQDLWPDFGILAGLLHESRSVEMMRRIEQLAYRAADRLIVPTEGYRQAVLAKGIPADAIEVIPNWIPDEDATPPASSEVAAVRRAEGWEGRFVVLFAGNLGNAQGLETVIEAASRLDESSPNGSDVLLAFAGDGTDRASIAQQVAARGLGDRVQFLGRRDPATMPVLAGAADALLVHLRPSPLADVVVPTKLNGYLAYGRPILCALGGEGADLLRRADAGLVVAPGDPDALVRGVRELQSLDGAEREAMGARGRAFARRELIASSLLSRYEAALGLEDEEPNRRASSDGPAAKVLPVPATVPRGEPRGRLLVTGATGSIGPAVVAAARASNWAVRVFVRELRPFPDDVEVAVGDIRDPDAVRAAVAGCDVVIHLAGVAHRTGPGTDDEHGTVTRDGARTVFAEAEAAGCQRVVFASSIAVYGRDGAFDEQAPLRPTNAYGAAKVAAEVDLRARTAPDGRPLGAIVRLATCYGPDAAGNVSAMLDALGRRRFVLVGSGANRKTLLHVDDAAQAILLAAESPRAAGGTYDVSDGDPRPLEQIVEAMCNALGRPMPARVPTSPLRVAIRLAERGARTLGRIAPVDVARVDTLVADVAVPAVRIRDELGFVPRIDLATGVAAMVDARRQGSAR